MAEQGLSVNREELESLLRDPHDDVRVNAAMFLCGSCGDGVVKETDRLLSSEDPRVRSAVIQCLAVRSSEQEDEWLEGIARSFMERGGRDDRLAVAAAAGRRRGRSRLHRFLGTLMEDPDLEVRRAALASAGATGQREFIDGLIGHLERREDRDAARAALALYGERVSGTLGDCLFDPTVEVAVKREVPYVLAAIGTQEAANSLLRASLQEDLVLTYRVVKALNRIRADRRHISFSPVEVSEHLKVEAEIYMDFLEDRRSILTASPGRPRDLLAGAVSSRAERALERIFRRLALIYPPNEMRLAFEGVSGKDPRARGEALEYLETVLSSDHRRLMITLLVEQESGEDRSPDRRPAVSAPARSLSKTLVRLSALKDPWLLTCVLFYVGAERLAELKELVAGALSSTEILVRDTAIWASTRVAGSPEIGEA
jgi:HEAT repeat protein